MSTYGCLHSLFTHAACIVRFSLYMLCARMDVVWYALFTHIVGVRACFGMPVRCMYVCIPW